ncbi:hypothetical protein Leryth_003901 [Lithospermum erythrorhizon]|nr:hypothetical protein Leryth_003901 [Lithospermum erythrorhizon]
MLSGRGKTLQGSHLVLLLYTKNAYVYSQVETYVDVYMNWKKDPYYDSIESIHKSIQLKPIIALKNIIVTSSPNDGYSIPISDISKAYHIICLYIDTFSGHSAITLFLIYAQTTHGCEL